MSAEDAESFAQRLGQLRAARSLSQEEAAERIGVSLRQYARWEAGDALPRAPMLRAIAAAFDSTPSALIGLEAPDAAMEVLMSIASTLERIERALTTGFRELAEHDEFVRAEVERILTAQGQEPRPRPTRPPSGEDAQDLDP